MTSFDLQTTNVTRLALDLRAAASPKTKIAVHIDGARLEVKIGAGGGRVYLEKRGDQWQSSKPERSGVIRKRPGLQGPIDDAFMDRFLFVRPTGKPLLKESGDWVERELERATNEWRAQFRGEVELKDDRNVTAQDIATHHLVLWGDPQSNRLLGEMAHRLPLRWTRDRVEIGNQGFPAERVVPIMIYPNPQNPNRYVVINSGFTFWRAGDVSNAQQTPKLPDFAVVELTAAPDQIPIRGVVSAGFFDELWRPPKL